MPIPLRADFNAATVRLEAKGSKDGAQARRLLALAAIYEGANRPAGLIDRKPPGQPSRRTDVHRAALVQVIEDGPIPSIHGVVRWRLLDLCQWLWDTFEVRIAKPTLSPRGARAGLSQADGPSTPPCPGRGCDRGI